MRKLCLFLAAAIWFGCADTMTEDRILNPELPVAKENWRGNLAVDGRFRNEPPGRRMGFSSVLKWRLSRNPQRKEKREDKFRPFLEGLDTAHISRNSIVWLGHSSFLIDVGGVRIVTDPAFFNLAVMRRRVGMPCPPARIRADYLLVSHSHRDHFDRRSVRVLAENNPGMEALVPLGGERLFKGRVDKVQEAGWYQEYRVTDSLRIIFLPAKHWSKRGVGDTNKVLWGSFLIIGGGRKIFFAGDTAYDPKIFKEIRAMFGEIDVCLLPVGAYAPRWFMSGSHTDPEEAVRIFDELGGKTFVPMHYGTYNLSDEPAGEPIRDVRRLVEKSKLRELAVGEIWRL